MLKDLRTTVLLDHLVSHRLLVRLNRDWDKLSVWERRRTPCTSIPPRVPWRKDWLKMQSVVIRANLLYISSRHQRQRFPYIAESKMGQGGVICGFNICLVWKCSGLDLPCICFSSSLWVNTGTRKQNKSSLSCNEFAHLIPAGTLRV